MKVVGDTVNRLASVPESVMPEMLRSTVPVFDRVMVWSAELSTEMFPKSSDVPDTVGAGGAVASPFRVMVSTLPSFPHIIFKDADLLPDEVGAKTIVTTWLSCAESVKLWVAFVKWAESAPVGHILVTKNWESPGFDNVTVWLDELPTKTLPKSSDVVESDRVGGRGDA